jgi:predicted tellurium resistance membrane protein TerC
MKLINKNNFISIVCISFTLLVCGKLLLEKSMGFTDVHYTENIFTCLFFSVIITAILALHFYMQRFPLIPVLIVQYLSVIAVTAGFVKLADMIGNTSTNAMWQMVLSVTIPFVVSAIVYYITYFKQIKKANDIIAELNRDLSS